MADMDDKAGSNDNAGVDNTAEMTETHAFPSSGNKTTEATNGTSGSQAYTPENSHTPEAASENEIGGDATAHTANVYGEGATATQSFEQPVTAHGQYPHSASSSQQPQASFSQGIPTVQYSPWAPEAPPVSGATGGYPASSAYPQQQPLTEQASATQNPVWTGESSSTGDHKGFFAALFDFSFSHFITLKFAKLIYILAVALNAVFMFFVVIGASTFVFDDYYGFFSGLLIFIFAIIAAAVSALLNVIFLRIGLELAVSVIRLAQNSTEIKNKLNR